MVSRETEITLKALIVAILAEALLNIGFLTANATPILSSGQINFAGFLTPALIAPVILLAIVLIGFDFLFSHGWHFAEDIFAAFALTFYINAASPAVQFLTLNGLIAVLDMVFIFFLIATISRFLLEREDGVKAKAFKPSFSI